MLIGVALLVATALLAVRPVQARTTPHEALRSGGIAEKVDTRTDTVAVPDMQCKTCERTISVAVKKVKGVVSVSADADANVVVVTFNPRTTSRKKIERAIAAAGYDAGSAQTTAAARNALPMCCRPGAHD